ncbi:tail tube TT1 domain-containing protein [Staphylococcus chromogenes]
MALILEDTYGNQYQASVATTQVSNYSADGMLTFKLIENEQTAYYINDVGKMWRVRNVKGNTDNQRYTVVIVDRTSPKDKQIVEVTAREEQFDYLANSRVYSNITGSRTPDVYFQSVFEDTPYQFTFLGPMPNAISWENAGDGDDRLSMFLKGLNRYGLEYRFDYDSGMFELADEIARRPAYQINKRINANNVHHEEDATQFFTYAEGYGNYDDGDSMQQAKLKKAYTSKLANIPGIGKRHAPALTDGRITSESTMIKKLTELVESSLKVSVTLDFVALPDDYPYARPEIGDIIPVIDKDIGYKQDLRINEMKIYRDAKHRVYKHDVTVGDRSRKSRYNAATRGAISTIQDIASGRYVFSTDVMPAAVKSATNKLLAANTELGFGEYGIRAIDKDNPNYVTLMNSAGLGVSTDGGQTFRSAITRGAINADLITAGSINANYIKSGALATALVTIYGRDRLIEMTGDEIRLLGRTNDSATHLRPDGMRIRRPDGAWAIIDGIPEMSLSIQRNVFMHPNVTFDGQNYTSNSAYFVTYENFYVNHDARYLTASFGANLSGSSAYSSAYVKVRIREFGNDSGNATAETRIFATKSDATTFDSLTIDLGRPTYQPRQFYLEFAFDDSEASANNVAKVRTNRVFMKG